MPDAAMIFAAGFGTRMGALTKDKPKPLIEVAGKTLLDYSLDLTDEIPLCTRVVNAHYKSDQIAAHLCQRGGSIQIAEEKKILETGGGLRNALPLLGRNPVFTLNSDAIWTGQNPLLTLLKSWRAEEMDALLIQIPISAALEHRGKGDFFLNPVGQLFRRGENPDAPYVYGGIQIIKTDRLSAVKDDVFSLNVIWQDMLEQGRLFGAIHEGGWVDVGRPEGIAVAEALLAETPDV